MTIKTLLRFVCDSFTPPKPKWIKTKKQGTGLVCTAEINSIPLQIREKLRSNRSAEVFEAVGFVNPRNFLIDEVIS